jgi:hypothetical protein
LSDGSEIRATLHRPRPLANSPDYGQQNPQQKHDHSDDNEQLYHRHAASDDRLAFARRG